MGENNSFKNLNLIIALFKNKNFTFKQALTFYMENFDILDNIENVSEKIYFIYNHLDLYGLLLVNNDEYLFSIYLNENFQKIKELGKEDSYRDYIVEIIIDFLYSEKVKTMIPNIENLSLENKIKKLKKMNANPYGYYIK